MHRPLDELDRTTAEVSLKNHVIYQIQILTMPFSKSILVKMDLFLRGILEPCLETHFIALYRYAVTNAVYRV